MDRWKSRGGKSQRREEQKREDQRRERVRRKKMQVREKVGKVAKHYRVFPMICGSGGSKSRLAKAASAEPCGQMRDEKLHAVVGVKHISESKSTKRTILGLLLEVEMSKKCTPLWRKAHFQVKMYKNTPCWDHFSKLRCWKNAGIVGLKHIFQVETYKTRKARSTFGCWHVEKVHVVVAQSTFPSQNVKTTHLFGPLLDVQMSFCLGGARDCAPCRQKPATRWGFCSSLNYNHHCAPLRYTTTTTTPTTTTTTTLHYTTLH